VVAGGADLLVFGFNATSPSSEDDARIEACTRILNGEESAQTRALARWDRALAYARQKKYTLAREDLNELITSDYPFSATDRAGLSAFRGANSLKMGDYPAAFADFGRCIETSQDKIPWLIARFEAHKQAGDFGGARADYDKILQLQPNNVALKTG
jgi:tetratricopeptide (TPR) repeat protein